MLLTNLLIGQPDLGFGEFAARMLLQSGILVGVLYALDHLLRSRVRASVRYCMWLLVLVKLVLPTDLSFPSGIGYWIHLKHEVAIEQPAVVVPELMMPMNSDQESQSDASWFAPVQKVAENRSANTETQASMPASGKTPITDESAQSPKFVLGTWLFYGWLSGVTLLGGVFLFRLISVRKLVSRGRAPSGRYIRIFEDCRIRIGYSGRAKIKVSPEVGSPSVCGLFSPMVLIPLGLDRDLDDEQLEMVLLHELGHIQRGDLWVGFLQSVFQILYFYNPFVFIANHRIRLLREQANDERVLFYLRGSKEGYSHTLIDVASVVFNNPLSMRPIMGIVEGKNHLNNRIKFMMQRPIPNTARMRLSEILAIALLALLLLPMARGDEKERNAPIVGGPSDEVAFDVTVDPTHEQLSYEVLGLCSTMMESFNTGNVNRLVSLVADDGILVANEEGIVVGETALRQHYTNRFRELGGVQLLSMQYDSMEYWKAGDLLIGISKYETTFQLPNVRYAMTVFKKDLCVFRRTSGGGLVAQVVADSFEPQPSSGAAYRNRRIQGPSQMLFHDIAGGSRKATSEELETIKEKDKAFHQCFIEKDLKSAIDYYADDGMLLPLGKPVLRGKEAIGGYILTNGDSGKLIDSHQKIVDVGGNDEFIYLINQFRWEFIDSATQQTNSIPGKGVHVWQKQSNGEWKIFLDLYNVDIRLPQQ